MAIASVGLFASACDVHGISDVGSLTSITVSPNPQSLLVNSTQQFTAVGRDAAGAVVGITPTFSIASGGGTITPSGMFTAGTTPGTYTNTIKATSGSQSGMATVTVTIGPLATITVTPNPATLAIGTTQQFVAVGRDAGGNVVTITPTWAATAGGTMNATGLFTAGNVLGTYTNAVTATSGNIVGTATVVVTPGPVATIVVSPNPVTLDVNATQTFTAVARDVGGNVVTFTPVWSVTNGGGSIDAATGIFTAGVTPGTFANTVRATSGAIFGTATVNVNTPPPVLTTIIVSPNPATLAPGATQQFAAVGRDANGNTISITPVWSVVNGGGTIDAVTGVFTAGAAGGSFANTVRATSGAVSGFATVNVVAPPVPVLTTITVTPNPATLNPGATQQFTAIGRDQFGAGIAFTPTWTVVNGGGAINSATGLFAAGAASGTFNNTVKATSGAISGTATVIVNPVLTTITITPNPANLNTNATQQFSAVGRDQNGAVIAFVPVWSVANGGGVINASTGLFTAGNVGGTFTNTVRATSGAIFGTATVIVAAPFNPIVDLRTASPNGIMAGTAFTCVINGVINANIAISPGVTVTGFPPCVITGVQHLGDGVADQAQIDLTAAYNTLAGLPCPPANFIVGNLGGTTKTAGVYCSATSIGVTGNLILDGGGNPNAEFIFQAGTSLITAGNIILINGADAKNVYWQVGSSATLGTASQWQGNILALTSITLVDNANLHGRALARNGAVSLGTSNVVTLP